MSDAKDHDLYRPDHYEAGSAKPSDTGPRHGTEPEGSEEAAKTTKTRTDPHTGEPTEGRPDTAG